MFFGRILRDSLEGPVHNFLTFSLLILVLLCVCGGLHQTWLVITFSIIWKEKKSVNNFVIFFISTFDTEVSDFSHISISFQGTKFIDSCVSSRRANNIKFKVYSFSLFLKRTFYSFLHNFLLKVEDAFRHSVVLFPNPEENDYRVDEEGEQQQQTGHLRPRDTELRPGHFFSLHEKISIFKCVYLFLQPLVAS